MEQNCFMNWCKFSETKQSSANAMQMQAEKKKKKQQQLLRIGD
jgi:hypothetical protein